MADDTFFKEEQQTEEVQVPEKYQVGGEEYSQDELERLVGLGKIGVEAEDKYKTKIDRIWPEFTRKSQRLSETEQRIAELEQKTQVAQPAEQTRLTPDQRQEAIRQLDDLLKESKVLRETALQTSREDADARELVGRVNSMLEAAQADGKPAANTLDILNYMSETGIKQPDIAYEVMFRDDLRKLDSEKLASLKPGGMVTTTQSTAGSKLPPAVKQPKNREELLAAVAEELNKGNQGI